MTKVCAKSQAKKYYGNLGQFCFIIESTFLDITIITQPYRSNVVGSIVNNQAQINPPTDYILSVLGDQPYPSFEIRNIVRFLDNHDDMDSSDLLKHIDISRSQLSEDFIPAFKMLKAFKYCSNHLGPVAGAYIGTTYQVSDIGVFGYAIASCKDVEHALLMAEKYNSLIGNLLKRASTVKNGTMVAKLYNVQNIDQDSLGFFVALGNSARLNIARSIFGDDLKFQNISFTFNDEKNRATYERIYGCTVEFDAEFNGWDVDEVNLKRKLQEGNHADIAKYLPYCNELSENIRQKDSLVNEIQEILISCAGDYPDIEMLASAFKVSSRTLRRQLSNLGTSYQKILNKVRCQLSIEYLTRTEITIEDISNLIGFSDVTNFRHAFKKWVGKTPSFYRKTYQNS
jgi:AraC-like DNA-binding protein